MSTASPQPLSTQGVFRQSDGREGRNGCFLMEQDAGIPHDPGKAGQAHAAGLLLRGEESGFLGGQWREGAGAADLALPAGVIAAAGHLKTNAGLLQNSGQRLFTGKTPVLDSGVGMDGKRWHKLLLSSLIAS